MRKNMRIWLAALFCAAALLVGLVPAAAATGPVVTVGNAAVSQGSTCVLKVSAQGLKALTSLQLEIAYNADVFSVRGIETRSMDIATADDKTAGTVKYIGISMNGVSGSCDLMEITFMASAGAVPGDYPVQIFVAGATADKGSGDEHVAVAVQSGILTVQENGTVSFFSTVSAEAIETGENVTFTVSSYSLNGLAGGSFVFLYDSSMFTYQSLELLPAITGAEYTHTINVSNDGRVMLSFVSDKAVLTGDLMRLTLKAKENVTGSSQITMDPKDLVNVNANPLKADGVGSVVSVSEKSRVWIELPDNLNTHESFTVSFWVEGCSGLAAGDFSLRYDPDALSCVSASSSLSSGENNTTANGYVVINDAIYDGVVSFSVLCPQGISKDTCLITAEFCTRTYVETEILLETKTETKPVDRYNNNILLFCDTTSATIAASEHPCINGYCTVCEKDVITIEQTDMLVSVTVPGVESGGKVVAAVYEESGKMVAYQLQDPADGTLLQIALPDNTDPDRITVFVMGNTWFPLREQISKPITIS